MFSKRVAVLDMHDGFPNQGMRCIKELIGDYQYYGHDLSFDVYDVRGKSELPDAERHDIYISSGGPGTPFDGSGKDWEKKYFRFIDRVYEHNLRAKRKKYIFFICYSYQMMCRFFNLGKVDKRSKTSFGIFPVHKTEAGKRDRILEGLPEPYFAVDSRDWQLTEPFYENIAELGAAILSLEKHRPHVDYERALMAIRLSPEMVGTQFHPEAEAITMETYFRQEDKKQKVIEGFSQEKYAGMLAGLADPNQIRLTHSTVLPAFLNNAVSKLQAANEGIRVFA